MTAIEAVVFDFDGLILDTEGPTFQAWQEVFVAYGCPPLTIEEWADEIGTVGGLDIVEVMRSRTRVPVDEDEVQALRRTRRDELLLDAIALPGVLEWIAEATNRGMPVAIASSSKADWVVPHLEQLGLHDRFAHVACFGNGVRAKPEPDVYLAACAALAVDPTHALAVEDSPNGVRAAKAAGMWCVAVPHAITAQLDLSHADLVVSSLADVSLDDVITRLR